ncbi:MAG TPA: diguanylate cyclase [Longimicrobiales bacterium]|nr:diguanylate cyclase [Longimicrobiales bacterium]
MNNNESELPLVLVAVQATVAGFAALGFISLVPVATTPGTFLIVVPVLGITASAGLLLGGRHVVSRARRAATMNALVDPLTGLATRYAGEHALAADFAAAQRGRPLNVVLTRVEQFPLFAARHGRPGAERVLRAVGRALRKQTRGMHMTAHHGRHDGTFISILSDVPLDGACTFAKRARRELASLPGMPEPLVVTASVVPYDVSMSSPRELVDAAERALARGLESGGKVMVLGQLATATAE